VVLRKALAGYPAAQLGNWTWILVRSENWKAIVRPEDSIRTAPPLPFYPKRETFIEGSAGDASTSAERGIAVEVEHGQDGPS